jgi:peptide-methionine (S)-S-oxide reductase
MGRKIALKLGGALVAAVLVGLAFTGTAPARQQVPEPALDVRAPAQAGLQEAVLAGGCFWGVEAVFEHVKGVTDVVSGYAGGTVRNPDYYAVGSGRTGHAEAVRIVFDPRQVSYAQLLKVYFSVAHDPTQLNRQGPDTGTQYRSAIFYTSPGQQRIAAAYIAQMRKAGTFGKAAIVTQLQPLSQFWPAEAYHQDFARLNPTHPYIVFHDAPKVARLKARYPGMYRTQWGSQLAGAPASR